MAESASKNSGEDWRVRTGTPQDRVLVLGSKSKGRSKVMKEQGLEFVQMKADIDEKAVGDRSQGKPEELTLQIARAKAEALRRSCPEKSVLITSDQVVAYKGTIREKPVSDEECRQYLHSYESEPACTVTAVVVIDTVTGKQVEGTDTARQFFKPIPDDIITKLIAKGDVMHCCGGFMIDDPLMEPYLDRREGSEDSIIGLPMALVWRLLKEVNASSASS